MGWRREAAVWSCATRTEMLPDGAGATRRTPGQTAFVGLGPRVGGSWAPGRYPLEAASICCRSVLVSRIST